MFAFNSVQSTVTVGLTGFHLSSIWSIVILIFNGILEKGLLGEIGVKMGKTSARKRNSTHLMVIPRKWSKSG